MTFYYSETIDNSAKLSRVSNLINSFNLYTYVRMTITETTSIDKYDQVYINREGTVNKKIRINYLWKSNVNNQPNSTKLRNQRWIYLRVNYCFWNTLFMELIYFVSIELFLILGVEKPKHADNAE